MRPRVIGLGAGGHAKVVLDILHLRGDADLLALLDPNRIGDEVGGVRVVGGDDRLAALVEEGASHAFVGVGAIGDPATRTRLRESVRSAGLALIDAIHPRAIIASSARYGPGLVACAGAVINPEAELGTNVIVNTLAVVEHDCLVGDDAHVATGARLAGGVKVGEGAMVGIGASVREGVHIGAGAIIGAGAAVVRDVAPGSVVVGVPARALEERR